MGDGLCLPREVGRTQERFTSPQDTRTILVFVDTLQNRQNEPFPTQCPSGPQQMAISRLSLVTKSLSTLQNHVLVQTSDHSSACPYILFILWLVKKNFPSSWKLGCMNCMQGQIARSAFCFWQASLPSVLSRASGVKQAQRSAAKPAVTLSGGDNGLEPSSCARLNLHLNSRHLSVHFGNLKFV